MSIEQTANKYIEANKIRSEKRDSFIKQILLIASSLLGILIALTDNDCPSRFEKLAFSTAIVLGALGILLLAISLYEQVDSYSRLSRDYLQLLRKQLKESTYEEFVSVSSKAHYTVFEKIGYFSLILSIISLTIYGILSI